MTEEKKKALRNSMAGKKVSELNLEERELYDVEFKYNFSPSDRPVKAPPASKQTHQLLNLPSTMEFFVQDSTSFSRLKSDDGNAF